MSYFDPHQTTQVIVVASPVGLGALLVQNDKVICYASCILSDVETRYSQTEKEMFAVVWAVEHFQPNQRNKMTRNSNQRLRTHPDPIMSRSIPFNKMSMNLNIYMRRFPLAPYCTHLINYCQSC